MKKKIVPWLLICIVIILAYFYAYIDKNSYIYDKNADTGSFYSTGILVEGEEIAQTFTAEEKSIDGLNLKISLLGNVEDVIVNYTILNEGDEVIFTGNVAASELKNSKFNRLEIPKITGTKEKEYTVVLSEEKTDEQNGVAFYIVPGSKTNHQLTIKGNETDGTLIARSICHRFDVETFIVLLGIIVFVAVFMKILYKLFR